MLPQRLVEHAQPVCYTIEGSLEDISSWASFIYTVINQFIKRRYTLFAMRLAKGAGDVPCHSILVLLGLIILLYGTTFSLMVPFYSKEAVQRGMSITETGVIYSCKYFMIIVTSPLLGKYIESIGSREMLLLGTLVTALGTSSFGFLQLIDGKYAFLGLSLTIRMITSMAGNALSTAIYPLTINAAGESDR